MDTVVLLLVVLIGSVVISLSRYCLPNDEGPGPPPNIFSWNRHWKSLPSSASAQQEYILLDLYRHSALDRFNTHCRPALYYVTVVSVCHLTAALQRFLLRTNLDYSL